MKASKRYVQLLPSPQSPILARGQSSHPRWYEHEHKRSNHCHAKERVPAIECPVAQLLPQFPAVCLIRELNAHMSLHA
jgi:hypothetical protein